MSQVVIVTDSTCCLPRELIEKYGIRIVPMLINYHNQSYRDGVDISAGEVYKIMRRREDLPTTATTPPGQFLTLFREIVKETNQILCITVTGLQSKVYESAIIARDMLRAELSRIDAEVFDSRSVAGALGFIVLEAARKAAAGGSINEALAVAKNIQSRVNFLAMVDTLYFLARTGRVARAAAWATSILDIKPLLEHSPAVGETTPFARPRTKEKAVEDMLKEMKKRMGNNKVHVMVSHADELEECLKLKAKIESMFKCVEIFISEFTPIMGVHSGPGVLAIAFYAD